MGQHYYILMFTVFFSSLDGLLLRNTSAFLIDVKANNHQVTTDPQSSQQEHRIISFQRDMNLLKQEVGILKQSHQNYPSEELSQLKSVIMSLKETMHELKGEVINLQVAKSDLIEELKQVQKKMYRTGNKTAKLEIKCAAFQKDLSHLITNKTKKLENSIDILEKSVLANISSLNQKISYTDAWLKLISFTTNSCCQSVKCGLQLLQQNTVILWNTVSGQHLFIRGGIDDRHRSGCKDIPLASMNNCSIPIKSRDLGSGGLAAAYNAWRKRDTFLDLYEPQPGQGTFQGKGAHGTPAVWTTNNPSDGRYNKLKKFDEHYSLVDIDMDCSMTINGWFEVKAFMGYHENGNWEGNILQGSNTCYGTERTPYENVNHWAKCGMMNVFHFNQCPCQIYSLN
ncbi:AMY [Mytilus coruscus]|uniref:AMY n=1 Tax=Mytilus coruscus TaxID=42192 RepID=A0A6J8BRY7_MYTCO|nr:AMY [Mytilus coruscus]